MLKKLLLLVVLIAGLFGTLYLLPPEPVIPEDQLVSSAVLSSQNHLQKIELSNLSKLDDSRYIVRGSIVENEEYKPVEFIVTKIDKKWKVTSVTVGSYVGDLDWVTASTTDSGITYLYPETLQTEYISTAEWPPQVTIMQGEFDCSKGERHTIGDRVYCVTTASEGAAGSVYTTYKYVSIYVDSLAQITFTLRFPQCANYDEPKQSTCNSERENLDIDGLVDRIASSIKL